VARPKLIGVGVYGPGDKQVGKIDDLMVDRTDATQTIVIGVGAPDGLANLLERRVAGKRLGRPTKQTDGRNPLLRGRRGRQRPKLERLEDKLHDVSDRRRGKRLLASRVVERRSLFPVAVARRLQVTLVEVANPCASRSR